MPVALEGAGEGDTVAYGGIAAKGKSFIVHRRPVIFREFNVCQQLYCIALEGVVLALLNKQEQIGKVPHLIGLSCRFGTLCHRRQHSCQHHCRQQYRQNSFMQLHGVTPP